MLPYIIPQTLFAFGLLAPSGGTPVTTPSTTAETAPESTAPAVAPTGGSEGLDPYRTWTLRLGAAIYASNDDPTRGVADLTALLSEAPPYASKLGRDDPARNQRNDALLALAQAHLVLGDQDAAIATMDEALRSAGQDPLRIDRYGPDLNQLYRQRVAALDQAGKGSIQINCRTSCRVFLDEHPAPSTASGLWVGPYRVHVESSDGTYPAVDQVIVVQAGEVATLNFPNAVAEPTPEGPRTPAPLTLDPSKEEQGQAKKKNKRVLPRWLEVTAIVGGTAAMGAGAFLLVANARCVGDLSFKPTPENPGTCTDIYKTQIGGITALSVGAAFLTGGVITLSIDAKRTRNQRKSDPPSGQSVMLGYTRRF